MRVAMPKGAWRPVFVSIPLSLRERAGVRGSTQSVAKFCWYVFSAVPSPPAPLPKGEGKCLPMTPLHVVQIVMLALVQGLAELLPVSSSAHVIVAEKLMELDPAAPEQTLLLVMLHTGHDVRRDRLFLAGLDGRAFSPPAKCSSSRRSDWESPRC